MLFFIYFEGDFNKTVIPRAFVGYDIIILNSALRASCAVYLSCTFPVNVN